MSIRIEDTSKHFGRATALEQVSLRVPDGKLVALLGPSGSGKTTLLRILAGLEYPDAGSGSVYFHDQDVSQLPARDRQVGMVFQHYALFRHMTVAENVAFGLTVRPRKLRPDKAEISRRVNELLEKVQLADYARRLPTQLSGGQRQRVALARALAIQPRILLLDEPFGALDAKVRKELRRWLRHIHESINLTTVFVTHDQEEALELADEVVVMSEGKIEQQGTPQEVFDHPVSPFVIEFMGNVNRVIGGLNGRHKIPQSDSLYVRPHDIQIQREVEGASIGARILHIFSAGSVARVTVQRDDSPETLEVELPRAELDKLQLNPGEAVHLKFRHVRIFSTGEAGRHQLQEVDL